MAQHPQPEERQSYGLGEEDTTNAGGNLSERISNTSNDEVFKERRLLHKGRSMTVRHEISFTHQLKGELEN